MATGFGAVRRKAMLDWLSGNTATAPGAWSIGLWVGDSGEDGQSGAEVTGTNYARGTLTNGSTGWTTATSATPSVLASNQVITFNSGTTGTWSTGSTITHVALWTASGTTAGNFIGRALIGSGGIVVNAGVTSVTIAIGSLTMSATST